MSMIKMFKSIKNKVKRGVREWCESEGCEVDMEGLDGCETFSELEEWGREVSNEFEGFDGFGGWLDSFVEGVVE